jgi:hypothetical protein
MSRRKDGENMTGLEPLVVLGVKALIAKAGVAKATVVGAKAIASHGGLAATVGNQAVATAHAAGAAQAVQQTAQTALYAGTVIGTVGGAAAAYDGVRNGRPVRAAMGAAGAVSGGRRLFGG